MTTTLVPEAGEAGGPPGRGPGRIGRLVTAVLVFLVAAVVAPLLAPLGTKALYVAFGVVVVGVLLWTIRDLLGPPLTAAVARLHPTPTGARPLGRGRTILGIALAVLAGATLATLVVAMGKKGLYGLVAGVAAGAGTWLLWPLVQLLFDTPPMPAGAGALTPRPVGPGPSNGGRERDSVESPVGPYGGPYRPAPSKRSHPTSRVVGAAVCVFACGLVAFFAASAGSKMLLALTGGILIIGCLARARDKSLFGVFAAVFSLAFLVHKSFGSIDASIAGGAPSVYVTSFDAVLLLLYGLWIAEGSFVADVRAALRRRVLWVPLVGAVLLLPSTLAGGVFFGHAVSELVRMAWMYFLFFYVAVRVRTREMVWAVLAGFAVFAFVEIVVVLLQWKTGGVLGLSFLGVPTKLSLRITDTSELGRPFGTIIHPDFMGAVMGSIGLVAFALSLTLRRSLTKVGGFALAGGCFFCLYLAHTRAALVGLVLALLGSVAVGIAHGHLSWRTVGRVSLIALIAAVVFFPELQHQFEQNFGTGHFHEEIQSRLQLDDVAGRMIDSHPLIGVGLNNFQDAMGPYEERGVIFIQNPVQSLYLLYFAETGIIGMAGFLFVGIAMYNIAVRLARSRDRLFGGLGLGVATAMAFLMVEELLTFSLREDVPLAVYWILAGLAVACYRMAGLEGVRRRRHPALVWPHNPDSVGGTTGGAARPRTNGAVRPGTNGAVRPGTNGTRNPRPRVSQGAHHVIEVGAATGISRTARPRRAHAKARHVHPTPRHAHARRSRGIVLRPASESRRIRRNALIGGAILLASTSAVVGVTGSAHAQPSGAVPVGDMMVVYSARLDSAPGVVPYNGIFEERADGTGLKVLAESSGNVYFNWPQWALGGTKIIYTVRSGPPVSSADPFPKFENLWEMNPDGSGKRPLTSYKFRAVQPKVSADGRSVIFTAQNPQYPLYAIYKLDLLTLQATNLSQTTRPDGAVDADPKWTPDGRIVMAATEANLPGTQIEEMDADGSNRQMLVDDGNFNTDPEFSPDGGRLAYSAFDGPNPLLPGAVPDPADPDDVPLNPQGWFVKVRDQTTGAVVNLTQGQACTGQGVTCTPGQSSGWKPVWSPDGSTVAWTGRLDATTTCICAANADGSDPRALIVSHRLQIKWFDWSAPGGQAPSTAVPDHLIGSQRPTSRLLISDGATSSAPSQILNEPDDMMGTDGAGSSSTLQPTEGSWSEHRAAMAFVASAPFDPTHPVYAPPPPPGQDVQVHFTLDELDPLLPSPYPPSGLSPDRQVFLRRPNGSIEQLTRAWTEDWRDAERPGDARSNTDPVISPNGRYVVFTNHSSLTGESFLLRLDLLTGDVLSLTNGTAGAMQVDDSLPKWSPDSTRIAFTWTDGLDTNVYVMNAVDGTHVTDISNDDGYDMDPTWSPDGSSIVFSHHDGALDPTAAEVEGLGGLPLTGWSLVRVDLATGRRTVLTAPADSPTWRPVFSPDGTQIAFIGWKYRTTDIFLTTPQGAPVHPLLITPLINETSIDWK